LDDRVGVRLISGEWVMYTRTADGRWVLDEIAR
jgi:hypothetical protein